MLMAYLDFKQGMTEEWFLNFGCSNHMNGSKGWFSELDENFRHAIKLGNDTRIVVMGKGSVWLNVNGVTHVISHVYYVPELKNNLLSIGQLQEKGLSILIQNRKCKVSHPERGQILEIEMKGNKMFVLTTTKAPLNSTCF